MEMQFRMENTGELNWKWRYLGIFFLVICSSLLPGCLSNAYGGQSCRWVFFNNTLIYGGTPNAAAMLPECQNTCQASTTCRGVDWSPTNQVGVRCFLHVTQSGKFSAYNVQHYDLGNCSDCVWNQFNSTNIPGGTENPATTLATCKTVCQSTVGCRGIDWANSNTPGQQCYLLQTQSGKNLAPGVTHYDLNCASGGACNWTLFTNIHIPGGTENGAMTLTDCQLTCQSTNTCLSIDWAAANQPGQQCYLQSTTSGKLRALGVDHYDLLGNCRAGGCTWTSFVNTHITGGTENLAITVATCQSACQSTAGCQSIDWANKNPSGQQCYLLQTKSGKNPASGVTHYDLTC